MPLQKKYRGKPIVSSELVDWGIGFIVKQPLDLNRVVGRTFSPRRHILVDVTAISTGCPT